jgi:hypothetical protein
MACRSVDIVPESMPLWTGTPARVFDGGVCSGGVDAGCGVTLGPNLVRDPSFEGDLSTWGGVGSTRAMVALDDAPDGTHAVQVTTDGTMTGFTLDDALPDTVPAFTPGQTYVAAAYVRAASPSTVGRPAAILLREHDPSGTYVTDQRSPPFVLTNTFERIVTTFTPTGAAGSVDVYVQCTESVAGDSFFVDAVSVQLVTAQ